MAPRTLGDGDRHLTVIRRCYLQPSDATAHDFTSWNCIGPDEGQMVKKLDDQVLMMTLFCIGSLLQTGCVSDLQAQPMSGDTGFSRLVGTSDTFCGDTDTCPRVQALKIRPLNAVGEV